MRHRHELPWWTQLIGPTLVCIGAAIVTVGAEGIRLALGLVVIGVILVVDVAIIRNRVTQ